MRHLRSTTEVMIDEALTLSLLAEIERAQGPPTDRLRLQKLVFLVTYAWFEKRWKGFNYPYFRYRRGPFTRDMYQTEIDLAETGLIECRSAWSIALTDEGRRLSEALVEHVWHTSENCDFWHEILDTVRQFAALDTASLVRHVYKMEVYPLGWREPCELEFVPIGIDLTRILEDDEAAAAIEMPPEWVDTFSLTLSDQSSETSAFAVHGL